MLFAKKETGKVYVGNFFLMVYYKKDEGKNLKLYIYEGPLWTL